MTHLLDSPIEFLKGVGPQRGELLRGELGITCFSDLLFHFPFRYIDRSRFHTVRELNEEFQQVQLRGRIGLPRTVGEKQAKRLVATFTDATGSMELVWFKGIRWVQQSIKPNEEYIVFGKPGSFKGKVNLPHPELELASTWDSGMEATLQPVYHTTEKLAAKGLTSRAIWKLQKALLPQLAGAITETLGPEQLQWLNGMGREEAMRLVHAPVDAHHLELARKRLKFEELFFIQLGLLRQKQITQRAVRGNVFAQVGDRVIGFYKDHLPFELTGAQKRVVKEIRKDMGSGKQMNRLLQGDVGSGKTLVGLLSMLIALDNGFQAALMAPTEILAQQHYATLTRMLGDMNVVVRILTGSTKTAERRSLLTALRMGEVHIIVGTHALLEDRVVFEKLGLVVIDEQHRFG
ncbi:MAG TPA: DEAD/DEAH box helicase, partial [Flavobacteriales bacterium]|nr:DEAD/DEAH box helicase [Flavobacteriales bacterium]